MKNKFSYCQSQIEGSNKCKIQCDHCKEYYKPLEEGEEHLPLNDIQPIKTSTMKELIKDYKIRLAQIKVGLPENHKHQAAINELVLDCQSLIASLESLSNEAGKSKLKQII